MVKLVIYGISFILWLALEALQFWIIYRIGKALIEHYFRCKEYYEAKKELDEVRENLWKGEKVIK